MLLERSGRRRQSAVNLADMFPAISGNGGYPLQPLSWPALKRQGIELLFLATPHEVSRSLVPEAIAHGTAGHRPKRRVAVESRRSIARYTDFKDEDSVTAAELTEKAIYGLPELNGDRIPGATLVANPGCYATSVILALAPSAAGRLGRSGARELFRIRSQASPARARNRPRAPTLFRWPTIFPRTRCLDIVTWEKFSSSWSLMPGN